MRIFLSYPHSHKTEAGQLATRLSAAGHDVFWDHLDLPAGQEFDESIAEAIGDCDLFIFLVTPTSLAPGKYALTELTLVEQKWRNPSGRVLPVMLDGADPGNIPPYLSSVTVLTPKGDMVAEVVAAVSRLRGPRKRSTALMAIPAAIAAIAAIAFGLWVMPRDNGPTAQLSISMRGDSYTSTIGEGTETLRPNTDYIQHFRAAKSGKRRVTESELEGLINADLDFVPPPTLVFNIVNQSDRTLLVDAIRLNVRESRPDLSPLLSVTSAPLGCAVHGAIRIRNDGWGTASNLKLTFTFSSRSDLGDDHTVAQTDPFSRSLAPIPPGEVSYVEVWMELETASGMDLAPVYDPEAHDATPADFFRTLVMLDDGTVEAASGKFADLLPDTRTALGLTAEEYDVLIDARLSFTGPDGQEAGMALAEVIHLDPPEPCVAPGIIAEEHYDIILQPDGTDYTRIKEIAHQIPAGAAEAIGLNILTAQSAFHTMTGEVRIDGEWIASPEVLKLEFYRPYDAGWGIVD